MPMKYNELPTQQILAKLLETRFKEPKTNIQIFNFYVASKPCYEFLYNEAAKHKGEGKEYIDRLVEQDIGTDLPAIELTSEDFETCAYSANKELWFNAAEINFILNWCEKQKEKEQG